MSICFLCEEDIAKTKEDQEIYRCMCPRCGNYQIEREVWDDYFRHNDFSQIKWKVSTFTRERTIHKQPVATITSPVMTFEAYTKDSMIDFETICNLFPKKFSDRMDRALFNLSKLSGYAGDAFILKDTDYPVIFPETNDTAAFFFILHALLKKGLINGSGSIPSEYTITPDGWDRIYYLETEKNPVSNQGFVAMWFDQTMDLAWDNGFCRAIEDSGFMPFKIDIKQHNNMINDEIIAEIRRSKFVVCDFTGQRGGVYFEAGFAMGLNKPVIWTCRSDHMKDCHFDTNHYNHIVWENEDDLYIKLYNRIRATIV